MSGKRILVTGGSGTLGDAIKWGYESSASKGDVKMWFPPRRELNVALDTDWQGAIEEFKPTEIWHFAAETAANSNPAFYLDVNILGTAYAAVHAQLQAIRLVYTSTDYVFGAVSDREAPYSEDSPVFPWNDYAWSKLAGEASVRMVPDHLIVRGSWYGDDTFDGWEFGATDAMTSKIYANVVAKDITRLALSGTTGTIHVGMDPPRSLRQVAHTAGYELTRSTAVEMDVPKTTALDTTRARRLLRHSIGI